jgi:Ca-activated chloride channel family protein
MTGERRSRLPLVVAAIVGIALIVGVRFFFAHGGSTKASPTPTASTKVDKTCVVVTLAASSEKAALLTGIANAYNAKRPTIDGKCGQVVVVSKASGGAETALARGWNTSIDGPRPDVWSPAASSWAVLLKQQLIAKDKTITLPDKFPSIAQTPLVIAMPRPEAVALGWPTKQIGWHDLFDLAKNPKGWGSLGHPAWGKFSLGKTNPHISTSGLNATIATYFAATGLTSDLTVKDVHAKATEDFVRGIESSVLHYGDTTLTFLGNMQKADAAGRGLSYVSAVTVEEKSVWDYNQGNPSGDPATLGQGTKPKVPLVAIYPKDGTLVSDSPYIVLPETWVSAAKKAVAADFLTYVRQPAQQAKFQAAAFRSYLGKPGPVLNAANGFSPAGPPIILPPPGRSVLPAIYDSWDQLRKPARVLLVVDVSGSMGDVVGDGGQSKLELAQMAAAQAIKNFGPNDEVGLWIFSSDLNGSPYQELVPIGPAKTTVPLMESQIAQLTPQNGTALYATIRAAEKKMKASFDQSKINAIVVMTDGQNSYAADSNLSSLVSQLRSGSAEDTVRVFTVGYGSDADIAALGAIADASSAAYYGAADPASITKVLISVLSNF